MDGNGTVRPERLLARLKINQSSDESGPRLIILRAPKGPDGSKGFAAHHRLLRVPGMLILGNGFRIESTELKCVFPLLFRRCRNRVK